MPHLEGSALLLLLSQIAIIVVISRVVGLLTDLLGQPLVIAEITAGIILGPSVLGLLWPGAMDALFPPTSLPPLRMLSQIGLVLFMFIVGLELDPRLLRERAFASFMVSHTSIIVPFALGAAAALWLHEIYPSPDGRLMPFLLFMGIAMSVTAFPVLARILAERDMLSTRIGAIAIACAAVDDVTAWCLLAFIATMARAEDHLQAVWITGLVVAYTAFMLWIVRPALAWVSIRAGEDAHMRRSMIAVLLCLLLLSSILTEAIGVHALFGAFLFGAIVPMRGQLARFLIERLETIAVMLLLPLFFAYSGLRTQIGLLSEPGDWLAALALIVLATAGKLGGGALAARLTGLNWREAGAIGILMNTRGLMELIVLNVGLDLGIISPAIFTMMVLMALVTTFVTTPLLNWIYPESRRHGMRANEGDSTVTAAM